MEKITAEEKHRRYVLELKSDPVVMEKLEDINRAEKAYKDMALHAEKCGFSISPELDREYRESVRRKREDLVLSVHKYAVSNFALNGKEQWQTYIGGRKVRLRSYRDLIQRMYRHYFPGMGYCPATVAEVFEMALESRKNENIKEKTERDYRNSFRVLIPEETASLDIRLVTTEDLKKILRDYSEKNRPTKKQFLRMKGLLNLIFRYASDPENGFIQSNPVPHNNGCYMSNFTPSRKDPADKAFAPDEVARIREHLNERIQVNGYDPTAEAILFASYTGLRAAEIPSLKWSDVGEKEIHIHSQQNDTLTDGRKTYYYNPLTKNEARYGDTYGRYFPVTAEIRKILERLKNGQMGLGIWSEDGWVFCREDGDWITTAGYHEALYKLCQKLGISRTNNHAFRMSLNSYVMIPLGIPVTERARLLGHSVEMNERYYSHSRRNSNEKICILMDNAEKKKCPAMPSVLSSEQAMQPGYLNK